MPDVSRPSVAHLPVGAFAMVMGIGGLAAAWNRASDAWPVPGAIGAVLAWTAVAVLAALLIAYGVKTVRHPQVVAAEWRHPIRTAFTATIPIATLVTAVGLQPHHGPTSAVLWWAGAGTMLLVSVWVIRTWSTDAQLTHVHVHPAWFIPVVGNLVVPLAGVEHAPVDISWFFFGVGILYWLGLLPIVLTRLFVHGVIPPRLAPTLAIMVAPPAVAAIAWVRLGGEWSDPLGRILLAVTLFNMITLAVHAGALRAAPFALPAWAYTFPLAAAAVAFISAFHEGSGDFYAWAGGVTLALASAFVLALAVRTAHGFRTGELLQPEP
ncbi:SLAC1 anion channel family protein [Demequina sp. SO4-18]|uniref:SLAC1 anion channel family protein n=1 Tax=Demequina sp. SO4-18 TaxID=3401026 RepID=UPI003B5A62C5